MYLAELDRKTGLLKLDKNFDGLIAIRLFRDILQDESLRIEAGHEFPGIHCLTAIALTADYQSPIRFYNDEDRPKKAMEEVTGKRNAFEWNVEKIQKALLRYEELQYDPTIEEGKLHFHRKTNKIKELKESEQYFGKGLKGPNGEELTFRAPSKVAEDLRKINEDIKLYKAQVQGEDVYDSSPVVQGYELSRLEQKIEKKNSFYKDKR